MDFIVGLPESNGFTQIWVVVDRLTKMAHFIPMVTGKESPAKVLAITFAREIWCLHGLLSDIVSDRGSVFISGFWKELMEHLWVDLNLSTAFHPQTDGQTERVNQVLEGYLCHCTNFQQDDWAELLTLAEHVYNTATSESTKVSPFRQLWVQSRDPVGEANGHRSSEDGLDESSCREAATALVGNLVFPSGQHPSVPGANGKVLQRPLPEATYVEARGYGDGQHEEHGIEKAIQEAGPQELGTGRGAGGSGHACFQS